MAEYHEAPANATAPQKLLNWVDNRFPLSKLYNEHVGRVLRAEELQLLVRVRVAGDAGARDPDSHRHLPGDELQARCERWPSLRSSTSCATCRAAGSFATCTPQVPARSSSWSTCTCSAGLLYGSYRKPRELVWLFGCGIFLMPDGRGLHGLPAALGPDELLGCAGDREPVRRRAVRRPRPGTADPRRLRRRRRHAQPVLQLPRDRGAAGAAGPGRRAHHRVARSGF